MYPRIGQFLTRFSSVSHIALHILVSLEQVELKVDISKSDMWFTSRGRFDSVYGVFRVHY
jgi:hypothetical protein